MVVLVHQWISMEYGVYMIYACAYDRVRVCVRAREIFFSIVTLWMCGGETNTLLACITGNGCV